MLFRGRSRKALGSIYPKVTRMTAAAKNVFCRLARERTHNSWPPKPKALGTKDTRPLYIIR